MVESVVGGIAASLLITRAMPSTSASNYTSSWRSSGFAGSTRGDFRTVARRQIGSTTNMASSYDANWVDQTGSEIPGQSYRRT